VQDDEQILQFAVQVAADRDLFADGRAGLVQIRQSPQNGGRVSQNLPGNMCVHSGWL